MIYSYLAEDQYRYLKDNLFELIHLSSVNYCGTFLYFPNLFESFWTWLKSDILSRMYLSSNMLFM